MKMENSKCSKNPILDNCEECKFLKECMTNYLKLSTHIPFFITDYYLPILSRHATNILLFLARRANFGKDNNNFGICWASNRQIAEATNVPRSNLRRYTLELQEHKLIEIFRILKFDDKNHPKKITSSSNKYTVTWFKAINNLKDLLGK
jgi:hypothetical protein